MGLLNRERGEWKDIHGNEFFWIFFWIDKTIVAGKREVLPALFYSYAVLASSNCNKLILARFL
jgi:hypothetical protein